MRFLKSNIVYLILVSFIAAIVFVPGLRLKIRDLFVPVAEIESAISFSAGDMDVELKGINVPSTNLKELQKKDLIFLNFWGTWCPPCREEWPTIQKLYEARGNEVEFVLIAMQDKEEQVKAFLEKNKYTVPVYIAQSPISDKMLPKVFPTTFLIGKEGQILMKDDASRDWNSKSVHDFIDHSIR